MTFSQTLLQCFTEDLGWQNIPDLAGHFSVSPDRGEFARVFSADIKNRQFGKILLGVIGVYSTHDKEWRVRLGLSAYITNFRDFVDPPVLTSAKDISQWVNKIADGVYSLPEDEEAMLSGVELGRLGKYDLHVFLDTTPWSKDFIKYIAARSHREFIGIGSS